ncbi:mule transposase protein [Fusarium langsethiae]|uniref:Mule transposase protein n=1 Tax=Fusarium langsethiae TaxID=179993 RepID=A0A0N0V571_FUSLA|nr:mule transposase protein [Fusarium langsethiae]
MSSPEVERRIGLRRPRSLSPSNQIHREKRQRTSRQASFSPPLLVNRPNSAGSSAASIGQYYGVGDEDTLSNLFASYPQTFSTFPLPHGSQGLHEPAWDLRFDYEIHLLNEFPSGRTRLQRVRAPIPGPEIDPAPFSSPPEPAQRPPTATRAEFESAMKIVRQVVGEGQRLTIDLARSYERVRAWRERWGWSPLSSDAYESPPPYSPPRKSPTQILQVSPRAESPESLPFQQISSPSPGPIPNPPIPGDPAPSAEALFDSDDG